MLFPNKREIYRYRYRPKLVEKYWYIGYRQKSNIGISDSGKNQISVYRIAAKSNIGYRQKSNIGISDSGKNPISVYRISAKSNISISDIGKSPILVYRISAKIQYRYIG